MIDVLESGDKVETIKVDENWAFSIDLSRFGYDQGGVYKYQPIEGVPYTKVASWELVNNGEIEYSNVEQDIPDHVTKIIRLNANKDCRDE